jgi:hypothetical protein
MIHDDRAIAERLTSDEMKAVVKEAITEWLDHRFLLVGKWTINGVLAAGLAGLVYFILIHSGWKQP